MNAVIYIMDEKKYLECEKYYVFLLLIFVAGFYGGFTISVKGGSFANAQTVNIALLGIAIGTRNFSSALSIFLSIGAYFIGTIISEQAAWLISKKRLLRWDTILVFLDMLVITALAIAPIHTPALIYSITINFLCAMQFNTFRSAEGIGMATIFITNHVRQTGSFFTRWMRKPYEKTYLKKWTRHGGMVVSFCLGAAFCSLLGLKFHTKVLLFADIPLFIIFINLLRADLTTERLLLGKRVPSGH